jgi:hypothetical protein
MFKKAVCLFYCDLAYTQNTRHENTIKERLENIGIFKDLKSTSNIQEKISTLPPGTIFSKEINSGKIYVSLPFFSSHLKIPVKVGEYVWVYEEENSLNSTNSICNSYWLSRIHGLYTSEDVNYTYNIRDNILKIQDIVNNNKKLKDIFIKQPTNKFFQFSDGYKLSSAKDYQEKGYMTSIPRYYSNEKDFTIQGSNNTLITLTNLSGKSGNYEKSNSKEGKILITSGRGKYFTKNSGSIKTKTINNLNKSINKTESSKVFFQSSEISTKPPSIINNEGVEENFKLPKIYTSELSSKLNLTRNESEGSHNINYDASSILVLENANHSYFSENERFTLENIGEIIYDIEKNDSIKNLKIKESLSNKKTNKAKYSSYVKDIKNSKSPLINLYSTDIKIIARNDSELRKDFKNGSIYLIKDSQRIEDYGEISIRENGNVILNGNKIILGSYERERERENGLGSSVLLGIGGDLNSLVLGEKLVSLLSELIEINKSSLKLISEALIETKENFDDCNNNFNNINTWANTHVHISAPPNTPTTPTTAAGTSASSPVILNVSNIEKSSEKIVKIKDPKLTDKLDDLIVRMDSILSKFSKTS